MKTAMKKKKCVAEILKTTNLSNKIICRPPQSRETIPLKTSLRHSHTVPVPKIICISALQQSLSWLEQMQGYLLGFVAIWMYVRKTRHNDIGSRFLCGDFCLYSVEQDSQEGRFVESLAILIMFYWNKNSKAPANLTLHKCFYYYYISLVFCKIGKCRYTVLIKQGYPKTSIFN